MNPRRTAGSDSIPWDVVKACVKQLSGNPHHAVQPLPDSCHHSHLSALVIIPILQKTGIDSLNDYRPIALTSVAMKCFKQKAQQQLHFLRILRKNNLDRSCCWSSATPQWRASRPTAWVFCTPLLSTGCPTPPDSWTGSSLGHLDC